MTTFLVGTNRFENCEVLLDHQGLAVLGIANDDETLAVNLQMPEGATPLRIEDNKVTEGEAVVVHARGLVSVIVDQTLVLHAARLPTDEVLVDLDLRSLGAAIYTDVTGLHIAQSTLAGNLVQGARVAISLS